MTYLIEGIERDTDDDGYLLEPDFSVDAVRVIAAAEGVELGEAHWAVVDYLRECYRQDGHSPNFRAMLKDLQARDPALNSQTLYALFPMGPAKQGARIAGLPQPYGKGGY